MNVCGLSSLQVLYESLEVKFPDGEALADVHGLRDDIELFPYQRVRRDALNAFHPRILTRCGHRKRC